MGTSNNVTGVGKGKLGVRRKEMKAEMAEVLAKAMVDEVGLTETLVILQKARVAVERKHPYKLLPDFIGMAAFAKNYEEQNEGRS